MLTNHYFLHLQVTQPFPSQIPESIMETCSVVLTFESVDEILWCDHSNETSLAVLLCATIYFSIFYKMKFGIFLQFGFLGLFGVKRLRGVTHRGIQTLTNRHFLHLQVKRCHFSAEKCKGVKRNGRNSYFIRDKFVRQLQKCLKYEKCSLERSQRTIFIVDFNQACLTLVARLFLYKMLLLQATGNRANAAFLGDLIS